MANRRPQAGGSGGRRMDYRNDRSKNFGGRSGVSPWQGGGPGAGLPNLLPLGGGSTEATLALASNIINLLQPRQNPVPSLLDMPIRRDFVPNMGRFDRNYGPNRMGNQGNFRRTGNYNRAGERINTNRKQFKPNDGPRQQNKSSPKKDADSKAKPVKESDADEKNKDGGDIDKREDGKKDPPKTRYDEINPQLLKCHICNKSMWDGRSFENHLSGRAHAIMMQKTAESYALTADTMRQEFKIREMKRTRKSGVQQPSRDFYCAMCDMYATDGAVHRTSVGHRKLKKYLHPTCTACHKEMPTRIELDEHRLCADHLRNMQDKQDVVTKPKPEVMVISTLTMEQSYLRDDRQRKRRDHDKTATETDNKDGEENQDQEIKKEAPDAETTEESKPEKSSIDNDKTIIDYKEGDDLSHVTSDMIPVYSTERGVGASFLSEFRCVQCRLCRKLLDGAGTAAVHLRTWKHHQLFVRSLQPQQNQDVKKRGGDEDKIKLENNAEEEQNDADGETEEPGSKRRIGDDDDGQWKRRKTTNNGEEQDDIEQNGHEEVGVKEELNKTADNVPDGDLEMPPAEELEDWEQSVDEILNDEKESNDVPEEPVKEAPEPEPVKEAPAPEPVKEAPAPPAARPRGSPRARARGRGRTRGRY